MHVVGRWIAASLCLLASCAGKSTATSRLEPGAGGTAAVVAGGSGDPGGGAGSGGAGASAGASAPGGAALGGADAEPSAGLGGAANTEEAGGAGGLAEAGSGGSGSSDDEGVTYDTDGFVGGYNHLWIRRRTASGECHSLALVQPSNERTLDIDLPERWGIEGGSGRGCTAGGDPLTGGVGWVRFTGSAGTCTVDFDFTLSFTTSAGGSYAVHFVATAVPRPPGLATPDCR